MARNSTTKWVAPLTCLSNRTPRDTPALIRCRPLADPTELFNQLDGRNKAFEAILGVKGFFKQKKHSDFYMWPKAAYEDFSCYPQVPNYAEGMGMWVDYNREDILDKPGEDNTKVVPVKTMIQAGHQLCAALNNAVNEEEARRFLSTCSTFFSITLPIPIHSSTPHPSPPHPALWH